MDKYQLIKDALEGKSTGRPPFSFWTHLPAVDLEPVDLARETVNFYREFNLDFVKTMNNGLYCVEDFGCCCDFSEVKTGGVARVTKSPITCLNDWWSLEPPSLEKGALARELESLKILLNEIKDEVPVVFTVFSPLTTAHKLSKGLVLEHLGSDDSKAVHHGLRVIAQATARLAARAIELGASGVFLASQMARRDLMKESTYLEFGAPYDRMVLKGAATGWFNIYHLHGEEVMFETIMDAPVQALNWHIWDAGPDIANARNMTDKCLVGGIRRQALFNSDLTTLKMDIGKAIEQSRGNRLVLTPGCVVRQPIVSDLLKQIRTLIMESASLI